MGCCCLTSHAQKKGSKKASAKAKAKLTSEPKAPKDPGKLHFPGTKKHSPILYGHSTVYIDAGNLLWRIKPHPGERTMINRSFKGGNAKEAWKGVVSVLKKENP